VTRGRASTQLLGVCIALAGCATVASPAYASFGLRTLAASFDQAPPPGSSLETLGPPDLQAGSHPYQFTASFAFNTTTNSRGEVLPDESVKDLQIELPPGVAGDPKAVPQCSMVELASGGLLGKGGCPADTQVGVLTLHLPTSAITIPVFNLIAPAGVAAQFGVDAFTPIVMGLALNPSDYGMVVRLHDLSQAAPLVAISMALWGVPADPGHDGFRGACLQSNGTSQGSCPSGAPLVPLLTMPTSCGEPLTTAVTADSWQNPGTQVEASTVAGEGDGAPSDLSGCDRLHFDPTITVQPEASATDTPTGLSIGVNMPPQESSGGVAEANLKDISVELPDGLSLNPATAAGLSSCSPAQIGLGEASTPTCPSSSEVGTFEIQSPVLTQALQGAIYVAEPAAGPFDGVVAVYLAGEADGLALKLAGQLTAQPGSGQLTFGLQNAPDMPLNELKLDLAGGPRAALATPLGCGVFTTTAELTPYSAPESGPPDVQSSSFAIGEGCGGGFAPSLNAGATSAAAGQGTGFSLRLARSDGQQYIQTFASALPPGLLGDVGAVPLCGNVQVTTGACPESSEVGTVTVGAGAGPDPYRLSGRVYLTGPYEGAPFGIEMVIPAAAGPFDLGTVVVRGRIAVDLATSSLAISTDPFPNSLGGIPLRVRDVELAIERPGFMVNPTDCARQTIAGTVGSTAGTSVAVSAPFQVVGCSKLSFAPKLGATTLAGASSRGQGATLRIRVTNARGAHANLASVSMALPEALKPRLAAVQQACLGAVFAVNRGACPPASVVGRAVVDTPMLNTPLAGPMYLVFYRGTKYPKLVTALRGSGLEIQMTGLLTINKGQGSTTFKALPDVPMSLFELDLPAGRHSLLGATEHLCDRRHSVGYTMVGQNGAQRRGDVGVVVEGCHLHPVRRGLVRTRRSLVKAYPPSGRRRG
jgi:hypothetical protein